MGARVASGAPRAWWEYRSRGDVAVAEHDRPGEQRGEGVAGDPDTAARRERAQRQLASLTDHAIGDADPGARERQVAAAISQGQSNAEIAGACT
jgi:ATP/maltotriose-dependent transcriptional regulator MalT